MTQSVWPNDHDVEPTAVGKEDINKLNCFVLSPTQPKPLFDELFGMVKTICKQLGNSLTSRRRKQSLFNIGRWPLFFNRLRTAFALYTKSVSELRCYQ